MNPIFPNPTFAGVADSRAAAIDTAPKTRPRFDSMLRTSLDRVDQSPKTTKEQVRQLAGQLVSVALIKPMLAQARNSPFKSDLLHGGQGETIFQEHLDTVLSDRIAKRTELPIVDAMYRRLMMRMGQPVHGVGAGVANTQTRGVDMQSTMDLHG